MSAEAFVQLLRRLNCPDVPSPTDLQWLTRDDRTRALIDWISTNLSQANFVTAKEVDFFNNLQKDGAALEGDALSRELHRLTSEDGPSLDELQKDIADLGRDLLPLTSRLDQLSAQRDRLVAHLTARSSRAEELAKVIDKASSELRAELPVVIRDNTRMDQTLKSLATCAAALTQVHAPTAAAASTVRTPYFPSQADAEVRAYQDAEGDNARALSAFVKKQFHDGFMGLAVDDDASQYKWLAISDPAAMYVSRTAPDAFEQDRVELLRLQSVDAVAQQHVVDAKVAQARATAALASVNKSIAALQRGTMDDLQTLRRQLKERTATVETLLEELQEAQNACTARIGENAQLQPMSVICGNYQLKLARQHYIRSKQNTLITQLLQQKARRELLSLLYNLQSDDHHAARHALQTSADILDDSLRLADLRIKTMKDLIASAQPKQTVTRRDHLAQNLHKILEGSGKDEAKILSYDKVAQACASVKAKRDALRRQLEDSEKQKLNQLASLEKQVEACERLLFGASYIPGTPYKTPQLSPQILVSNLSLLESSLDAVTRGIKQLSDGMNEFSEQLRSDPMLRLEHSLFVSFFTNPNSLASAFQLLQRRFADLQASYGSALRS